MRRLLPDPAETSVDEALAPLDFAGWAPEERPYLFTNFVLSLDGRATLGGRSGELGSETDTAMLVGLRKRAEAVMIGAGTMRVERYGQLRHNRLVCVVSGSLELPWDAELFTCGEGRVVVFTTSEDDPPETATAVHLVRTEGMVDLGEAMRYLRAEESIRSLLCEGGPHLHAQLIEAEVVDELFVTHAAKLAGGEGPHLVAGLPERERALELAWLLHEPTTGELFARYRVPR
jgi:riboflavin biosynthesis pyrimidine reductase